MKSIIVSLLSLLAWQCATAQTEKCWVYFTDKSGTSFNPYEYFDSKAIDRREKLGLDLNDSTDFPVNSNYLEVIEELALEVSYSSRWFNAVAARLDKNAIEKVESLPFVKEVAIFPKADRELSSAPEYMVVSDPRTTNLAKAQTVRMGRRDFIKAGIDGSNVRIAVFDAGFTGADTNPAFDHLRADNRILKTFDFVKKNEHVYLGSSHGTSVLSCIAGIYYDPSRKIQDTLGLATGAEFLLARTERALLEVFSEEENWLAAIEWADKEGADIINSSLGYTGNRYTYADMTGNGTLVSRAGNLAAKKGILVVNSAGNDGTSDWNFIGAPADADSVLAIGGLSPWSGIQTSFSSVGPTYDYRFKPNVTAYGHVIAANKYGSISETQGTSFSSPLMAGFAACAWQSHPEWNNMQLFEALELRGDLYPYFDYAHGYGVPLAKNFLETNDSSVPPTFDVVEANQDAISIKIRIPSEQDDSNATDELDMLFGRTIDCVLDYEDQLFFHFENEAGSLLFYSTVDMKGESNYTIYIPSGAVTFRCYYEGYTKEIKL